MLLWISDRSENYMSDDKRNDNDSKTSTTVIEKTDTKSKKPSMYKVVMLNDDYNSINI